MFFTQSAGTEADIIVLCLTPGAAGIVLIVDLTALILLLKTGLRALFRLAVQTDDAVGTVGHIRIDESMKTIVPFLQNIVSISAYDYAGTLFSQL